MNHWNKFFNEKILKIFSEKKRIIDIGGGLRISQKKGNRFDPGRAWILPLAKKANYLIMDPVSDYEPDIVGDIHNLPLEDNSEEAILCLAVLEHVENPFQATAEMYRVLKKGGFCFVFVPFLYYYHPESTYYKDYWRFTRDSLDLLFKQFSNKEVFSVRGPLGTLVRLSPFGRYKLFEEIAYIFDRFFGKLRSNQVSGYYVFLTK